MGVGYCRYYPLTSCGVLGNYWQLFCPNLAAIVQCVAWPGSTIRCESWAVCDHLQPLLGFQHARVNHHDPDFCFLPPLDVHTQNIESCWDKEEVTGTRWIHIYPNVWAASDSGILLSVSPYCIHQNGFLLIHVETLGFSLF